MSGHAPEPTTRRAAITVALALALAAAAFGADGGLRLGRITLVEVVALVVCGGLAAALILARGGGAARVGGATALTAFAAFAVLTALSVAWSVNPSDSWLEANRTITWCAIFATAALAAASLRDGWSILLGALLISGTVISLYAIATKMIPASLSPDETYARLRAPYAYWNSVGLTAATTIPCAMWLAARRHGNQAVSALAYPAITIAVVALLLAYSRGALLAAALACLLWIGIVPLRLRALTALAVGSTGALTICLWAFGQSALAEDKVSLALRQTAGLQLLVLTAAILVVVLGAGLAAQFATARRAPGHAARRTLGTIFAAGALLVPLVGVGVLSTSEKGLGGSISSGWDSLTNPDAVTPANDPSRLTAVGSVRARYWNEALKAFEDNPAVGVGAGGYAVVRTRYRTDELDVLHAHGYVVQVLADLGIAGVLVTLLLLMSWLGAARRACGLRRQDREAAWTPERVGLVTLLTVVVLFGIHSFVDWTWYVPGNVIPAMLAAGWLAGRGALGTAINPGAVAVSLRQAARDGLADRTRLVLACAVIGLAALAAWTAWQPWSANRTEQDALAALERGKTSEALGLARDAVARNPLAIEPRFTLAAIRSSTGDADGARRELTEAVKQQPRNPRSWLELARFELAAGNAAAAQKAIAPALYLDPKSSEAGGLFLQSRGGVTETIPAPAGTAELGP